MTGLLRKELRISLSNLVSQETVYAKLLLMRITLFFFQGKERCGLWRERERETDRERAPAWAYGRLLL